MTGLVLWDVDHTLIDTRGVGRELSASAFLQTTGQRMRQQARIDGITEPVIFRETAKLHGLTTDRADFERFARDLAAAHLERAAELRERGHALPGAVAALNALADAGVRQTVVSGNIRAVAELKLQVFGLDAPVLWELGAYGEDHDVRADLVGLSLERAHTTAGAAVLIGDTPADIEEPTPTECARSPSPPAEATKPYSATPAHRWSCLICGTPNCWSSSYATASETGAASS